MILEWFLSNINRKNCVYIALVVFSIYYIISYSLSLHQDSPSSMVVINERADLISTTNQVVFLIRTYKGHFDESKFFKITRMVQSLRTLQNKNWTAYLLNTDTSPLPIKGHPIAALMATDKRIRVLTAPVSIPYNKWTAGYDVTDAALDILRPSNFEWIVITNGDNMYEPRFLNYLSTGDRADIVLTNYWSRWSRADSIDISLHSSTVCHKGRLQPGFVDVGGAVLNFIKFQQQGHRFMKFGPVNGQDGLTFTKLAFLNWTHKVIPECLFMHAPNPYACNKLGGVWWNSPKSLDDLGDGCLTLDQAKLKSLVATPKPSISLSASGIKILSIPEPDHSSNHNLMMIEQGIFAEEYDRRMRKMRGPFCKSLRDQSLKSGWKFDVQGYAKLNPDLVSVGLTQEQMSSHFWGSGCFEMRPITNAMSEYFLIEN